MISLEKIKAVGLFSGGLDSALAIKLVQEQGIEVVALNYISPFCTCVSGNCSIVDLAKKLGVEIKVLNKGKDYLRMIRKPKYGYGKNMNPCIDCKIYILKGAKKFAKQIGAKFVFTGEVLGQRPMSQHYKTLMLIEKEAGLTGKLVRPLSAKLLPPVEAEQKGWIDREKLLKFNGRTRSPQIDLAKKFRIDGFMCGGSGCRLTDKEYSAKLNDLFCHKKKTDITDIKLLNIGRHFRRRADGGDLCEEEGSIECKNDCESDCKIIVGRNKLENEALASLKKKNDYQFEAEEVKGPVAITQGKTAREDIIFAARLTARYSDAATQKVVVLYGKSKLDHKIEVEKASDEETNKQRVC